MGIKISNPNWKNEARRMHEGTEQFKDMVKASVSSYVEEIINRGAEPSLEQYLDRNPDHDHEDLYTTIEAVIVRELAYHGKERVSA